MRDDVVARWADLLVDYCLRVERDETIVISSAIEARPLVEACFKAIVQRGGHPLVRLELPGLHEFFLEHAERGPTVSPAAGSALRGPGGRRAHPDRRRKRHSLDEPRRSRAGRRPSTARENRSARPRGSIAGS